MNRKEFISKQLEKYPRIPSVDVGIPSWVLLGYDVDIYKGAIIGETGFGITYVNGKNVLVPHAGGVMIGSRSVICAGAHIARATAKDKYTTLAENVFVDALVHIAHNCVIGERTRIVAGTVVGGSCNIKSDVDIGMNVSIKDHIQIAKGCYIGAGAIVVKDCDKENWVYANKVGKSGLVYAHPIRERREGETI